MSPETQKLTPPLDGQFLLATGLERVHLRELTVVDYRCSDPCCVAAFLFLVAV